ncbi:hypothetical protein DSO57_1033571 [Entomophthora muscae]|uniref:Uncharacterized protein n=1 Tax=Entomophthora muscae TaxID=34485 RepID=A0ACC2TLY3_9FUNG|nr:hypothetical protein DSO57_1033571 [Entomophthora muscae]
MRFLTASLLGLVGARLASTLAKVIGGMMSDNAPDSNINDSPVYMRWVSIRDAKYYANLAAAAFCEDASLLRFSCHPYCEEIRFGTDEFSETSDVRVVEVIRDFFSGVRGYVAVIPSREEIIVSFASERPQSNKLVLISAPLEHINVRSLEANNTNINVDDVAVHTGLYTTAKSLLSQYRDTVRRLLDQTGYKLVFAGHSIGAEVASLSLIAAQREFKLPWTQLRYIGYGMIRVGNREFARWFNQQRLEATHVVNFDDKVVHLMPRFANYQHFANELFIDKDGSIRLCDNAYFEDPKCSGLEADFELKEPHVHAFEIEFGLTC